MQNDKSRAEKEYTGKLAVECQKKKTTKYRASINYFSSLMM